MQSTSIKQRRCALSCVAEPETFCCASLYIALHRDGSNGTSLRCAGCCMCSRSPQASRISSRERERHTNRRTEDDQQLEGARDNDDCASIGIQVNENCDSQIETRASNVAEQSMRRSNAEINWSKDSRIENHSEISSHETNPFDAGLSCKRSLAVIRMELPL